MKKPNSQEVDANKSKEDNNSSPDIQPLCKNRRYCGCGNKNMFYREINVKQAITNFEKELVEDKDENDYIELSVGEFCELLDKHFGKKGEGLR